MKQKVKSRGGLTGFGKEGETDIGREGAVHTLPPWGECFKLTLDPHFDCT